MSQEVVIYHMNPERTALAGSPGVGSVCGMPKKDLGLMMKYLRDRRAALEKRFAKIWPALARRRNLRSIFDLLGT